MADTYNQKTDRQDTAGSVYQKEIFKRRSRYILVFSVLTAAFLIVTVLNINTGNVHISLPEILKILARRGEGGTEANIIWKIRLPRVLMAAILGGALSLSGFLLQTFFSNPIAGPFVLGISSGAKMMVALAMIFFLERYAFVSSYTLIVAAFIGALISTGFILLLSRKMKHMATLLVGGIMIGYICSAITDFVVTFAEDSQIVNLHNWSMGSLSGIQWSGVRLSATLIMLGVLSAFFLSKPMGAYRLGETYARSMGVNIRGLRIALILISSLLSGVVTAFAGPISFVGIAVPHLIRGLIRSDEPIQMIPACFLGGSVVTLMCDGIARTLFAPTELSISSVTALFGAPVVIYMMIRRQTKRT